MGFTVDGIDLSFESGCEWTLYLETYTWHAAKTWQVPSWKLNGFAAYGHHAQFTQRHHASHVGRRFWWSCSGFLFGKDVFVKQISQFICHNLFLNRNLNYCFKELEFTGVMRFYYQAQDLGSGQKVCVDLSWVRSEHGWIFVWDLDLISKPQLRSGLSLDIVETSPIDSENLLKHSSGQHQLWERTIVLRTIFFSNNIMHADQTESQWKSTWRKINYIFNKY